MAYKVKIDMFEGPFDLLVYLIENSEMNIYDIQIASITKQYLEYIEEMKSLDINVATEFMLLASILIEIKSKMLLPRMRPEGGIDMQEDPRGELVEKILEYKKFRKAAETLEKQEEYMLGIFEKPKEDLSRYTKEPDEYLSLDIKQFAAAFNLFLYKKMKVEEIQKKYSRVERQRVTIEDSIKKILDFFKKNSWKKATFDEIIGAEAPKYEKVVTFVSLLEMMKKGSVKVGQSRTFGDITVSIKGKENLDDK